MNKKKYLRFLFVMTVSVILALAMTACGSSDSGDEESTEAATAEQLEPDMDALMQQVAEEQAQNDYKDYVPEKAFANCEVFGTDTEGESYTSYVYLNTGEYVAVHDKAYMMTGGSGEAILKYDVTEDGTKLNEIIWSADGSDHDEWLEENFPEEYLAKDKEYNPHDDETGVSNLDKKLIPVVEEEMGVTVETENLLTIDVENGTYEIFKTVESGSGDDYKFDTETIEKGKLSDLNS